MTLESLINQNETDTINLGLTTGRVRADVKPPAGTKTNFSVQTPAATASVRGTVFDLDTAAVRVIEGTVSFQPSGDLARRPVMVSAGQQFWIDSDSGEAVAESSLALPALPGYTAASTKSGGGGKPENPYGNLLIQVELSGGATDASTADK